MSTATLSIVIPAFNESENLEILVEEIAAIRDRVPGLVEVIVVDDGSTDGTREVSDAIAARTEWLRVVRLEMNRGQTAALAAGFAAATGDIVATIDADLQNDPADIPRLVDLLESSGADMIAGVRRHRQDSLWKRVQSRIGNEMRNLITGDRVQDTGCTLRVSSREIVDGLLEFDGAHRFVPTLAKIRGAVVLEEVVNHRSRRFGSSKYGAINRAIDGIAQCFRVRRLRQRSLR